MKLRRCAGSFERLVLLSIERLQARAYGMMIRREIGYRTGSVRGPPRTRWMLMGRVPASW